MADADFSKGFRKSSEMNSEKLRQSSDNTVKRLICGIGWHPYGEDELL